MSLLDLALQGLRSHPFLRPGDRIVAAMSGGVDSSVMAALLHRAGFEVLGISMQLFDKGDGRAAAEGKCCTLDDFQDARRVAHEHGFPHYVVDFEERFRATVIESFIEGYLAGETPSPCIRCNQHVKFKTLLERADALGAAYVATGHYARITWDGQWHLHKAGDLAKDQSYFLFSHTQATLARTLFPLEGLTKVQVRELGRELGLHLAEKPESQEICFVTQDRYDAFLVGQGRDPGVGDGDIRLASSGAILGRHRGYWRYTVGQRKGLGVAFATPLYVLSVDRDTNTVWVGEDRELGGTTLAARELSWCQSAPSGPLPCEAKVRSRGQEAEALVIPLGPDRAQVTFFEPQRALAPGQAVVFYRGDEVLGGGWIDKV